MFCFRIVSLRTCEPSSPARHSSEPRHDRCRLGRPLEPILCGCSKACICSMFCCYCLEALCVVWRMHVCAPMHMRVGTQLCVLWRPKVNLRALFCIFVAGSLAQPGACHFSWNGLPESPPDLPSPPHFPQRRDYRSRLPHPTFYLGSTYPNSGPHAVWHTCHPLSCLPALFETCLFKHGASHIHFVLFCFSVLFFNLGSCLT